MQKFLGSPIPTFLMEFGIGAIAGFIANRVSALKSDLPLSMLLRIGGALIGSRVAGVLEISRSGIGELIAALLGSIFVLIGWRQIRSPR